MRQTNKKKLSRNNKSKYQIVNLKKDKPRKYRITKKKKKANRNKLPKNPKHVIYSGNVNYKFVQDESFSWIFFFKGNYKQSKSI